MLENNKYMKLTDFISLFENIISISNSTIKTLNKDFIIEIDKVFYIENNYIDAQVNLYNQSKSIKLLSKELTKINHCSTITSPSRLLNCLLRKNVKIYDIPLLSKDKFISLDDFNNIINCVKYVINSNCLTSKEVLASINQLFIVGKYTQMETSMIQNIMSDNNLDFISPNHLGNFTGANLITKEDSNLLLSKIKVFFESEILALNNLTYEEYYNMSHEEFSHNYVSYSEIENVLLEFISPPKSLGSYSFNYKFNLFSNSDIRVIGIRVPICDLFINKKDFDETIDILRSYVNTNYIATTLNLTCNIERKSLEAQGINVHLDLPLVTGQLYVKREDAEKYCKFYTYQKVLSNASTIFQRYSIRIDYYPNPKDILIPETLKLLNEYVLYRSNKRRTHGSFDAAFYDLYNILCDNLKLDLTLLSGDRLNKQLDKLLILSSSKCRVKEAWIGFINYLRTTNDNFKDVVFLKLIQDTKKVEPYGEESFINLAIALIDIIENKSLLKKTYYNWNVSSALCYVFLHLCLAWRRNDLSTKLPSPNLNLISNLGEYNNFIEWLEDDNELSERLSLTICKDIENKVNRFNLVANKNQQNLLCVIPKFLCKHLALLLCINETNKKLTKVTNKKVKRYDRIFTKSGIENLTKIFSQEFDTDLTAILGDTFNNIKATKSFLTLITEKSEEFGLSYGYYLAQKLRGHKSTPELLSNTTKIYLHKDISKASVMAFAVGTMGSVKYNLLSLVDDEFNDMSILNQANKIVSLSLTPHEIETIIKTLAIKSDEIKRIMATALTTKDRKDKFLDELLFGKNNYGKHPHTKCIFKIIKNIDNTLKEISVDENRKCPYRTESCIGCVYLIGLKYFMFYLEDKFNEVLDNLENSVSRIDKEIHLGRLQEIYLPTISDMFDIFGKETISNLLNTQRYKELVECCITEGIN
ncbi:hypothetical protein ACV3UL_14700 [Clostridium perfringens]